MRSRTAATTGEDQSSQECSKTEHGRVSLRAQRSSRTAHSISILCILSPVQLGYVHEQTHLVLLSRLSLGGEYLVVSRALQCGSSGCDCGRLATTGVSDGVGDIRLPGPIGSANLRRSFGYHGHHGALVEFRSQRDNTGIESSL